ncbi:ABC transporter ATP-binding protein/permease [Massilia sp. TS11]|uniref:ABCB family ABC transporter ATP-binding protein/permease n=1 Tax=Massilia sp. TS11 TaxID=2908003 RepID=UPI001EDB4A2F|nr:ABC transporter ATP-binding protein/permease [Massilia sp. TS11]MCG2586860.1 ABC transporter ATP-binding protein/permease [Massilia sp. TS11]
MQAMAGESSWWRPAPHAVGHELAELLRSARVRIGLALFCLILAKGATVLVPLVLKRIIEVLGQPAQLAAAPFALLGGYALLRFASTLFNELRDVLFAPIAHQTVARYAERTFIHLHRLGARFHTQRQLGGLLPDIDRGTGGLAFLLGTGIFTLVPTLLEIGLVLAIMLSQFAPGYAAIIAITFCAYVGFTLAMAARRTTWQRRVNKLDSTAKTRLTDSLINYDTVKYFANEDLEAQRFARLMTGWSEAAMRNQRALFLLHVGQSAIIGAGVAAIMLLAGRAVWAGDMSVGDLILINAYVLQVCLPLNSLGFVYREVRDAWVNVERLFSLLREPPEPADVLALPDLQPGPGNVLFDQVSFAYVPGRPVLQGVSLHLPAGRTVAVVGSSGSGKSTLARLLLRFYSPGRGRILLDGQDIAGVNAASLRRAIGVVPQDTVLFNDSIAYNIAYGRPGASRADVVAAARAARLHDSIMALPEGYDTIVGERGVKLSGGERQRLAIARVVLKNPAVLILDEATSALDAAAEQAIQQALEGLASQRSVLIIAHRLSTVVHADEIIVLERGRIEERGSHSALLAAGGFYARLWQLQQQLADEQRTHDVF